MNRTEGRFRIGQGFDVHASSGKPDKAGYLRGLGAAEVVDRQTLSEPNKRPMVAPLWAHGVDTVGGEILSNVIKSLSYGGSVAICGLVASANFNTTVLPFIIRGVNVLGIDSVELSIDEKTRVWSLLATDWRLDNLEEMVTETDLSGLSDVIETIFGGGVTGRTIVVHEG